MSSRHILSITAIAGLMLGTRRVSAAPVPFLGELPLTGDGVEMLRQELSPDELALTLEFLGSVRVFEDDGFRPRPIVYLAPSFAADVSQEVIGGQEIATNLLGYLDDLDALLVTIGGSYREFGRLVDVRTDYFALADQLTALGSRISQPQSQGLTAYAHNNPDLADLPAMPARIAAAVNQLPPSLRTQLVTELLAVLDALGVPLTTAERQQAFTDPVSFVVSVVSRVRARLATMLFGVRHASFVSGMTADDTRFFAHYFDVDAHATILALPIQVLRVVSLASAASADAPLGNRVSAPELIRGVNASTGGVCGLTTQCTVVIEYTEMGARSALLSTRGAAIMPVQFVSDVAVSAQALVTPTACDIDALRRHLVLPFGMAMLGDREILRVMTSAHVCHTPSGAVANPLASAVVLSAAFRDLFYDAAELSVPQREQQASELADLLAHTPGAAGALGIVGTILPSVDVDRYLDRLSRRLYRRLMPRFPDQLIAGLIVSSSSTAPATTRFDLDGFALACWKKAPGGSPYLSACPSSAPDPEIQDVAAADLEQRRCQQGSLELSECAAAIQAAPADGQGFLWTDI